METTWLTANIAFEMQNGTYPNKTLKRQFSNVKEDITGEAIQAIGDALCSLHTDDEFITAQLTTKSQYVAK